ncbi:MAG TPA: tetratricopeptide repeat protein [Planctomycetota bacterium]|nr:tetratricopeptide repeat protein [Planctomycetota bacterium]
MTARKKDEFPRSRFIEPDRRKADRIFASFEIRLSKSILDRDAKHVEALTILGAALTRAGRHEEALEVDLKTATLLRNEPTAFYNLACSYSVLNRVDEAIAALKKALDLGYRDWNHLLKDEDLKNVRGDDRFRELLRRKWGKRQP